METTDIVLAATLKISGCTLQKIEKSGNRGIFCFVDVPPTLISDFNLGKCLVEPVEFNNCIKALTTATRRTL